MNKQKRDKSSHHKSFQSISRPQENPNVINYIDKPDIPAISTNQPATKMPEKKVSFMSKLTEIFSSEKNVVQKQNSKLWLKIFNPKISTQIPLFKTSKWERFLAGQTSHPPSF